MMNLSIEEIIEKVKAANLKEFGVYHEDIVDKWHKIIASAADWEGDMALAAGLDNCDTDRMLLVLLKEDADKVISGMLLAAKVLGAKHLELHVPEGESELRASLGEKCADQNIEVVEGFINTRAFRGKAIHHIETMKALAEIAEGCYEPGTLTVIKRDGKMNTAVKTAFGTKIADMIGDVSDVKGVMIGTKLYDKATALEVVIDENLSVGNGVITLISDKQCIIAEAEKLLLKERQNGCGKCTFCREGLGQLHTMTKEITLGQGKASYLDMMKEIGEAMAFSTLCSVGQTGAQFTLDSMEKFANEYTDHIKKKKCTANVCSAFMSIYIDPNTCTGCEECADVCPVDAIEGKSGYIHMIDEFECTKCGKCISACDEEAIIQTTGRVPKLPTRLVKVGKFKKR
ncbi:MAG: 4Fe-4S binding protein [Clostridiales bacterium]|nr:4Fe-4S binding protein [Clostridiales bacterium]MDY3747557.1 NADH-ubiquinone oxidoreductase-F iron-sulfur binding region domain-containing protein [Lachnospiraceae bacterium]